MSLALTSDDKYVLVNVAGKGELAIWDLRTNEMVGKCTGHKQERYLLRATFGGVQDAFVACGSEDAQIYIYRKETGQVIQVCSGHASTVNAVSWNPKDPHMLASASDDHTIRIWGV